MTDSGAKAKRLKPGQQVILKGRAWTVEAADKSGDEVALVLVAGGERFRGRVPKGRVFELVPLHDERGAQTRWASEPEARREARQPPTEAQQRLDRKPVVHDDGEVPDLDPWVPSTDAEQAVATIMGGSLLGAQRLDDGAWFVPPVDGSTVMAHLLTFHATEPPSASLTDVRTPMAEQWDTAAEALMRADITGALQLHQQQHTDGLPDGATPHRHALA